jgi:hypothetical protein
VGRGLRHLRLAKEVISHGAKGLGLEPKVLLFFHKTGQALQ